MILFHQEAIVMVKMDASIVMILFHQEAIVMVKMDASIVMFPVTHALIPHCFPTRRSTPSGWPHSVAAIAFRHSVKSVNCLSSRVLSRGEVGNGQIYRPASRSRLMDRRLTEKLKFDFENAQTKEEKEEMMQKSSRYSRIVGTSRAIIRVYPAVQSKGAWQNAR
jgi:hypothetical protein